MSENIELLDLLESETEFGAASRKEHHHPPDPYAREIMSLAQRVFLSKNSAAPREVVLCGVDKHNASAKVCVQLARALAASSTKQVCLVDADEEASKLCKFVPLASPADGLESCVQVERNLWLAFLPEPHEAHQRLMELRHAFDHVIISAPGVNDGVFAALLSRTADGAILVIEANATRKIAAHRAKTTLESMNVQLLGTVLNNRTLPIPERLYRKL